MSIFFKIKKTATVFRALPLLCFSVIIFGGTSGESAWGADRLFPADDAREGVVILARHKGIPHDGPHSTGRAGSGICPQSRAIVQAPDDFLSRENPLKPTARNIEAGRTLFQVDTQPTACKICHGETGNGMGMMAQQALGPMPRNFTCKETMKDIPDGQLFWIIKNGSPGTAMPSYNLNLSDDQVWQLVLYIRQFAKTENGR